MTSWIKIFQLEKIAMIDSSVSALEKLEEFNFKNLCQT